MAESVTIDNCTAVCNINDNKNITNINFPARLYQIIENEDDEIIRWENDGKRFRIANHQRFESEILPKYFRHSRVASIQRQLNLYGFRCAHRGEEKGVFFHPNFVRGQFDDVVKIRRVKSAAQTNAASQPNMNPSAKQNNSKVSRTNQGVGIFNDAENQISSCLTMLGKRFYDEIIHGETEAKFAGNTAADLYHGSSTKPFENSQVMDYFNPQFAFPSMMNMFQFSSMPITTSMMPMYAYPFEQLSSLQCNFAENRPSDGMYMSQSGNKSHAQSQMNVDREYNCSDYVDDNWVNLRIEGFV